MRKSELLVLAFIFIPNASHALWEGSFINDPDLRYQLKVGEKISFKDRATVIKFDKNSSTLSEQDKKDIRSLIKRVQSFGHIYDVKVAVWSDQNLPSGNSLTNLDQRLVEKRLNNLENYLGHKLLVKKVNYINMAVQPGWISRTFKTEEARFKEQMNRTENESSQGKNKIVKRGEPSSAVLLVRYMIPQRLEIGRTMFAD